MAERASDIQLAYIAGFVDGEGCVQISKNGSLSLSIINTAHQTLTFIKRVLNCGSVAPRKQKVNKPQYVFRVYGTSAAEVLTALLPYLIEKRPQAELALEFFGRRAGVRIPGVRGVHKDPLRDEYIQNLKELKRVF